MPQLDWKDHLFFVLGVCLLIVICLNIYKLHRIANALEAPAKMQDRVL